MAARALRFRHHLASVLLAATAGSAVPALILPVLMLLTGQAMAIGLGGTVVVTLIVWLGVALMAVPAAALVLALLWPLTRRGTAGGRWVCVTAGITAGLLLAPLGSKGWHGASPTQMLIFALTGAVVAGLYGALLARFARRREPEPALAAVFA